MPVGTPSDRCRPQHRQAGRKPFDYETACLAGVFSLGLRRVLL
jgi:hypothetical protein